MINTAIKNELLSQGRLNAGGLCKACKNKKIKNNYSINNDITVSSDGMNNYYNNYVQSINSVKQC